MRALVMLFLVLALRAISPLYAAAITNEPAALVAATNGLATLKSLATNDFAGLGFASFGESQSATVGAPIQVYRIALETVKTYTTNVTFNGLTELDPQVQPATRLIVPVLSGAQAKSSITLRYDSVTNNWFVEKIGPTALAASLITATASVPNVYRNGPVFAVEFPLFDMWWIGYFGAADELKLITSRTMPLGPPVPTVAAFVEMPRGGMLKIGTTAQRFNERPN